MKGKSFLRYRIWILAMVLLMMLPLTPKVAYASVNVATPSNLEYEPTIVTATEEEVVSDNSAIVVTVEPGTYQFNFYSKDEGPEIWRSALPENVIGSWIIPNERSTQYTQCPVTWDLPNDTTNLTPGIQIITGTVSLPNDIPENEGGYQLAEGSETIEYHLCWNLAEVGDPYTGNTLPVNYADVNGGNAVYLAVEQGAALTDIEAALSQYKASLSLGGEIYSSTVDTAWDLSSVKPEETGVYTISGSLNLPVVFCLMEGIDPFYGFPPTAHIIVSKPGKVDVSNPVIYNDQSVRALWGYQGMDLSTAQLQYAIGKEGEWQTPHGEWQEHDGSYQYTLEPDEPAGEDGWTAAPIIGYLYSNELYLDLDGLAEIAGDEGARFYFRIRYGDNKISDVLMVEIPANWDEMAENPNIDWGGDRDMIDRTGEDTGDMEQPAPGGEEPAVTPAPENTPKPNKPAPPRDDRDEDDWEPVLPEFEPPELPEDEQPEAPDIPAETTGGDAKKMSSLRPSAVEETPSYSSPDDLEEQVTVDPDEQSPEQQAPPTERVTDTQTTISGERLRQMMEINPQTVLFEKQGIAVSLPTAFLRGLELQAHELLTVSIAPIPSGFILSIFRNEQPLYELPETLVRFPLDSADSGEGYVLSCAGDEVQIPVNWDGDTGLLSAYITNTGTYTFIKTAPTSQQGETASVEILSPAADAPELPAYALIFGAGALCIVSVLGLWIWRRSRRG